MEQEIRDKIAMIMKEKNISYMDISVSTGIPKSTIQRYVTKEINKVPIDRLALIAKALNVSPYYLLGYEENNEVEKYEVYVSDKETLDVINGYLDLPEEKKEIIKSMIKALSK